MGPSAEVYGNVIEYISDRLYLASYTSTPKNDTPFPPPAIPDPYKIMASSAPPPGPAGRHVPKQKNSIVNSSGLRPVYFNVDNSLLYNAFHHDFGPLHIGHLYRFAITLHDILGDPRNENRVVVFWSRPDVKARANAACMLACYMVLVQSWPPHLALSPLSNCDPPLQPFRDAGYSQADFSLTVQDVVYGVWKAKEKGLINLREFSLDEYEKYERVDMGDFNWVSPNFLAFASPQHEDPKSSPVDYPTEIADLATTNISQPFKNVLEHFTERDIGLVVRLNSRLYPAKYFESMGIEHKDMIFDDGTCPPLSLVRTFVNKAHDVITRLNRHVAVHCKAGLGRTGCLIGAYLVYRYGFTANEVIAYMRFMRPGMVVGPQQHWLHMNQNEFRQWWWEDTILRPELEKAHAMTGGSIPKTPSKKRTSANAATPLTTRRSILGEMDHNHTESAQAAALPAPTPGQPRKTSSRFPGTARKPVITRTQKEDENDFAPQTSPERASRRRRSGGPGATAKITLDEDELARALETGMTEEEFIIHLQKRVTTASSATPSTRNSDTRSNAASSTAGGSKRVVSYTTTTTHTVKEHVAGTSAVTPEEKRAERAERVGNGVSSGIRRSSPRKLAGTVAAVVGQTPGTKEVGGGVRKVSGGVARR